MEINDYILKDFVSAHRLYLDSWICPKNIILVKMNEYDNFITTISELKKYNINILIKDKLFGLSYNFLMNYDICELE